MCLLTQWQEPNVALEDIITFKLLKPPMIIRDHSNNDSLFNYYRAASYVLFEYEFGKLYETKIQESIEDCLFDSQANAEADRILGSSWQYSLLKKKKWKLIGPGFHSAYNPDRLITWGARNTYTICQCVIPAGSLYYEDLEGLLLVSNQIIVQKDLKIWSNGDTENRKKLDLFRLLRRQGVS